MSKACAVEECGLVVTARGFCGKHYALFRKYGVPDFAPPDLLCAVEGCRSLKRARGWCSKHYQVWAKYGDPTYRRPTAQDSPCTVDGCETKVHSKGLCCMHYRRNRLHGDPEKVWVNRVEKVCTVDGCDRPQRCRTYCSAHYQTWLKHGDASYVRPKGEVPHGTITGYGLHKCRCDACSAAQATSNRRNNLRSNYGLTPEDYDRMFDEQGGVCAICRRDGSATMYGRLMAVDHCHDTGRVRGLLCTACNTAIGHMQDDPDRLLAAAAYLLQHTDVLGAIK